MTDADLLRVAATAAGYDETPGGLAEFGATVLQLRERHVRNVRGGEGALSPLARIVCAAIVPQPALARELEHALIHGAPHV